MNSLIEDYTFEESCYTENGEEWSAATLYKAAKEQGCKAFKYPLKYFDMSTTRFLNVDNVFDFAHHAKRVANADTSIPVLFSPVGGLMDGYHRVVKALINGDTYILAYRLLVLPEPDECT